MPLTPREQVFVSQYLIDLNGKRAATEAGYKPDTAEVTASRMLKKPHVKEAIAAAQAVGFVQARIKADDILQGYAAVAFADITDYLNEDGSLKPISQWPKAGGKLIAKVKTKRIMEGTKEAETVEIQLWDKIGALNSLAKHFGLLVEQQHVTVEHKMARMTDAELDDFVNQAVKAGVLQTRNKTLAN
jgi:phage terminase small subunit